MGRPDAEVSSYEIDDQSTHLNEHEVGYDQNVQPQDVYDQQTLEQDQQQQAPPAQQQQQYPPPQQQQYPPPQPGSRQQYPPPPPPQQQQYPPPQQQQQYPPSQLGPRQQYPPPPLQQQQFPPQKQKNNPAWQGAGPYPPAQFPTQSQQNNPMYGMNNSPSYPPPPPPGTQQAGFQGQSTYPPQPVSFPPKADFAQQNMQMPPSPYTSTVSGVPVNQNQFPMQNGEWSSNLFDCMNDPTNALITACFPCVTFGQIAEIVDEGRTPCGTSGLIYGVIACLIGIPCIMSCTYRTKLRSQYGLMETPAPDWITHFLCEWCALCQEYRELSARGFDPAIGWQGNLPIMQLRQQQQQMAMMPPTNQAMMG